MEKGSLPISQSVKGNSDDMMASNAKPTAGVARIVAGPGNCTQMTEHEKRRRARVALQSRKKRARKKVKDDQLLEQHHMLVRKNKSLRAESIRLQRLTQEAAAVVQRLEDVDSLRAIRVSQGVRPLRSPLAHDAAITEQQILRSLNAPPLRTNPALSLADAGTSSYLGAEILHQATRGRGQLSTLLGVPPVRNSLMNELAALSPGSVLQPASSIGISVPSFSSAPVVRGGLLDLNSLALARSSLQTLGRPPVSHVDSSWYLSLPPGEQTISLPGVQTINGMSTTVNEHVDSLSLIRKLKALTESPSSML